MAVRLWFWLLLLRHRALAEDVTSYFVVGGTLTMRPPAASEILTSILWKFQGDMLAEWFEGQEPRYFDSIRGRTRLDTASGQMEVSNMSQADEGVFIVELNLKILDQRYVAKAIKEVPTPSVLVQPLTCSDASQRCTLRCDGDTAGAEPVTYSWRAGHGGWTQGSKSRSISIKDADVETFSCRMENPVSKRESQPEHNIFYQTPGTGGGLWVVWLCLVLLFLFGGGLAVFFMRDRIKQRFCSRDTAAVI